MHLIVIGGGNIEYDQDLKPVTKTAVADYLNELAAIVGHVTYIAHLYSGPALMSGQLDRSRVDVCTWSKKRPWTIPLTWLRVMRLLPQRPGFIVYLPSAILFVPILPLLRLFRLPLAVYLANDYVDIVNAERRKRRLLQALLQKHAHELGLRLANVVIARGRRLASLARQLNRNVHQTVPMSHASADSHSAIALPASLSIEPHGNTYGILYIGRMLRAKGVDVLLEAVNKLHQQHPDVDLRLWLVGAGTELDSLKQLAQSFGLHDIAEFFGWRDSAQEINDFYRASSVLVVPSLGLEGVPRVIDEAIVRGVPVVATSVGGIPDEFDANEILIVPPGDADQLARAIGLVLWDQTTRRKYLASGEDRRRLWSSSDSAARQHANLVFPEAISKETSFA